jgi:hypothetical protein
LELDRCISKKKQRFQFLNLFFFGLLLYCSKNNSPQIPTDKTFKSVIEIGINQLNHCIYSVNIDLSNNNSCTTDGLPIVPCSSYNIEKPFLSLSPKIAVDLILKAHSDLDRKYFKITKNIQTSTIIVKEGLDRTSLSEQQKFKDDFQNLFKTKKIKPDLFLINSNDFYSKAFLKFRDLPTNEKPLLVQEQDLFVLNKLNPKNLTPIVYEQKIGYLSIFENGSFFKKNFQTCRQPVSRVFKNIHSGWENFEDCRDFISGQFHLQTKDQKDLSFLNIGSTLYASGEIWSGIKTIIEKDTIERKDIHKKLKFYCKATIKEILDLKIQYNTASKACYSLSYADAIFKLLNVGSIEIIETNYTAAYTAISPDFQKECISKTKNTPIAPTKKK